ncbi:MAG: redoxin family protein, partial [Patescibacteria group bacterium]
LLDFWTYSCINCQRTFPYLNSWHEKYADKGFVIVGMHTPEFEFEKKYENVVAAAKMFGLKYPIVQDNDYGTWRAYGNQYWPRHYLIDIDGYIVEDHIGEGGYEETEKKIQELLAEKMARLGESGKVDMSLTKESAVPRASSPETYFGSLRNQYLGNGTPGQAGAAKFVAPQSPSPNTLYLDGKWNITPEYAENDGVAKIIYRYKAQNVYLVMSSKQGATAQILLDGKPVTIPGADVKNGKVGVKEERLYTLVSGKVVEEHILEIIIDTGSINVYAFTFG